MSATEHSRLLRRVAAIDSRAEVPLTPSEGPLSVEKPLSLLAPIRLAPLTAAHDSEAMSSGSALVQIAVAPELQTKPCPLSAAKVPRQLYGHASMGVYARHQKSCDDSGPTTQPRGS